MVAQYPQRYAQRRGNPLWLPQNGAGTGACIGAGTGACPYTYYSDLAFSNRARINATTASYTASRSPGVRPSTSNTTSSGALRSEE